MSGARDYGSRWAEPKGVSMAARATGVTGFNPWFKRQLAPAEHENTLCFRDRCAGAPYADRSPRAKRCVGRLAAIAAPAQPVRCAIAHSSPRPVASLQMVACGALLHTPNGFFFCPLTPARSSAINMDAQMLAHPWAGGSVAGATACNQKCNRLTIEIIVQFSLVARLHPLARVYHVTRARARAHVCVGLEKAQPAQPVQPINNMYVYPLVSGCTFGCAIPTGATSGGAGRLMSGAECLFSRETNCLMGGYSVALVATAILIRSSSLKPAPEAKNFRPGAAGSALAGGLDQARAALGKNGGFLRFSDGLRGPVGKGALEGMAQSAGFRAFQAIGRMIANLKANASPALDSPPLVDLGRHPRVPPLAPRLVPRPMAPEAYPVSFAPLNAGHLAMMRNSRIGGSGSGVSRPAIGHDEARRGRGIGRVSLGDVRRRADASREFADVK